MNERILELNAQADKYAWEKVGKKYDGAGDLNWKWEDTKMEKFAELVLKASFDVVINDGRFHDAKGIIRAGKYTAMEHFGIEE
jgi:hypothetical protein